MKTIASIPGHDRGMFPSLTLSEHCAMIVTVILTSHFNLSSPDFPRKYTAAVRAVVGRVSDGVRTTVRTDPCILLASSPQPSSRKKRSQ